MAPCRDSRHPPSCADSRRLFQASCASWTRRRLFQMSEELRSGSLERYLPPSQKPTPPLLPSPGGALARGLSLARSIPGGGAGLPKGDLPGDPFATLVVVLADGLVGAAPPRWSRGCSPETTLAPPVPRRVAAAPKPRRACPGDPCRCRAPSRPICGRLPAPSAAAFPRSLTMSRLRLTRSAASQDRFHS